MLLKVKKTHTKKLFLSIIFYLPYPARAFFGCLTPRGGGGGGGGGGRGRKVRAAHNSETTHGIVMKFCRVVENHILINLV